MGWLGMGLVARVLRSRRVFELEKIVNSKVFYGFFHAKMRLNARILLLSND